MENKEELIQSPEDTAGIVSKNNNLFTESNDLVEKIINESNPDKLEELTNLFNLNQRKKDIARINKLSQLLNIVDTEVESRLIDTPEGFNNDQLIKYMSTTQQTINSLEDNLNHKPLIQINNQTNEIHLGEDGLNQESRKKVIDTIMSILSKDNKEVIDIDLDEEE
jgi:hypothetical protein